MDDAEVGVLRRLEEAPKLSLASAVRLQSPEQEGVVSNRREDKLWPRETIRVSRASPDDAAAVHRVMQAGFSEYDGKLDPPTGSLRESVADVRRAMEEGGAVLAWIGDEPVGCARFEWGSQELYVGRVAVLPDYRRRGVATEMMRSLEAEAAAAGVPIIRVGVRMSLPTNVALYRRLGYRQVETRRPEHHTFLHRKLSGGVNAATPS